MSTLLREVMKQEGYTKAEALEVIRETFEECKQDHEETLFQLGFELDYSYDLMAIVASK
jgi:hypothetical protein